MSVGKNFKVVRLLWWKSWKIRLHYKKCFIALFVLPLIIPALMTINFKSSVHFEFFESNIRELPPVYTNPENLFDISFNRFSEGYCWHPPCIYIYSVYYTPDNEYTRKVMQYAKKVLDENAGKSNRQFILKAVENEHEIRQHIESPYSYYSFTNRTLGGISFLNTKPIPGKPIPFKIHYDIIVGEHIVTRNLYIYGFEYHRIANRALEASGYVERWFTLLQAAVDIAHLRILGNESLNMNVLLQNFPLPAMSNPHHSFDYLSPLVALSFSLSLLFIFPVTVKRIVEEKATRVKEYLVCCGVNPGLYWTTTFLDTFCIIAVQTIALILIYVIPIGVGVQIRDSFTMETNYVSFSVMGSLNASVILLMFVFIIYCIQTTLFASFLTIFFENANVAAAVSIVTSVLCAFYPIYSTFAEFNTLAFSCVLPNCALYWIIYAFRGRHFLGEERNGFSNLFESSRWGDSLSAGQVLTFMIFSSIVYGLLTWYLTEIWPWQKGVSKPWYFPFAKQYTRHVLRRRSDLTASSETPLIVSHVSKAYNSSRKPVLNNVSFSVEDKSLTVLLGPNGSGKSTLINIICGLSAQTEGIIFVNGSNTEYKLEKAQSYLGFCPQHNTYFKYLTVLENLELIFTLKRELRERIDGYTVGEIIEMLSLRQFAHQITSNLSGGILRRLTLAMAMVGPSDILVIDEPTESLDPMAKRRVWDILVQSRESKTILVCSHQLDEVNVIADKAAVLIYGEMKCIKTTLELKREYGMGYTLRIKKNPEVLTNEQIECIVTECIERASKEPNSPESEELVFHIPFHESKHIPAILRELEKQRFHLGIESMSLFATTLEDVYSQIIGSEGNCNEAAIDEWNFDSSTNEEMNGQREGIQRNKVHICFNQIMSLVWKNFYYTVQHLSLLIIYILIPLVLILIILLATRIILSKLALHLVDNQHSLTQDLYGKYTSSFVNSDNDSFVNAYKSISDGVNVYRGAASDLQNWLLKSSEKDLNHYLKYYIFGASFTKMVNGTLNLTAWINPFAVHAPPISLNTAMTAFLRMITQNYDYSITVENKWSKQKSDFDRQSSYQQMEIYDFVVFPLFIVIYALVYPAYVIRPVVERNLGFRHLQLMTGLHPLIYWSSHLIFDLLFNLVCSTVHILFFYLVDTEGVFTKSQYYFVSMFTVFFFAGFSQIPLMYSFSFCFKKSTSAYLFIAVFCIMFGLTLAPFTIGFTSTKAAFKVVLILAPFVAFPEALTSLHKAFVQNTICERIAGTKSLSFCIADYKAYIARRVCCPNLCPVNTTVWERTQNCTPSSNPFYYESGEYTVFSLICFMTISGLLYFALTNLTEIVLLNGYASQIYSSLKTSLGLIKLDRNFQKSENEEVIAEMNYVSDVVQTKRISQEALVIQELTKQFDSLRIPNRMNLTVRKGECFGLLGGNACGKTTTFRLLTSQLKPSFGNAFICDLDTSLTKNTRKYLSLIGYCPQNDALLDSLTGRQMMKLFMNLRGINDDHEMDVIAKKFQLQSVLRQKVSTYSGGNRRKLSLALALIGHQKLLLLDEPTNGVDPCSRHKVWQLLKHVSESFQVSILLTSHNMQEVEALCDRIAVMSIGKVMCIGSLNELRDKYGKGFNLVVKVERQIAESEQSMSTVKQMIEDKFVEEKLALKYENFGVLYYNLISNSISLSNIFGKLEEIRKECQLEDYIVSNANLEQSLLLFMKK